MRNISEHVRAVELDQQNERAYIQIGNLYFNQGKFDKRVFRYLKQSQINQLRENSSGGLILINKNPAFYPGYVVEIKGVEPLSCDCESHTLTN